MLPTEEAYLGTSHARTKPSPFSFWTPRGRLGQSQLDRQRRGRAEPTWVFGISARLCHPK